MPSVRNNQRPESADALLDAALECVLAVGLRRTTLTDVARRAGVSRMTAYRRFADVDELIRELMTREFGRLLARIDAEVGSLPDARSRLVEAIVLSVQRLPSEPLFRRVVDVDPELLLPYLVDRLGTTQQAAHALFAEQLRAGVADGSVRLLDVDEAAFQLLVLAQAHVFAGVRSLRSPDAVSEHQAEHRRAELALLLHRYLRPEA